MAVVHRLAVLQFDPLEVPGARNHELVLHARIRDYRREWCDELLYGPGRQLIEIYNKSLNIVPLTELPWYRLTWDRNAPRYDEGILREQSAVAEAILRRLREEGPLSTASFSEHNHAVDWWWAPTRAARAVMEALFVAGRLGIARRDGNRRYYDLIERLVPPELLARRESEQDAMHHRLLSRYRASGLTMPSAQAEVMYSAGSAPQRRRMTDELVEAGALVPVDVEGLVGTRYLPPDELPLLDDVTPVPAAVSFMAPLDPLMWDRRQLRELWAFEYLWEVYVPEHKRRWGYYVLPILFGERFVGRWEPRVDRRTATLRVVRMAWEQGFAPRAEAEFVPALRAAVRAYMEFTGTQTVESPNAALARLLGQPRSRTRPRRGAGQPCPAGAPNDRPSQ